MPVKRFAPVLTALVAALLSSRTARFAVAAALGVALWAVPARGTAAVGATNSTPPGSFVAVGAGRAYVCALRTDGTLFCWGANQYGQATPPSGTFVALSTGDETACAIRTDQTLACWGTYFGDFATPPTGSFVAISAGFDHACAIRSDATVACWSTYSGVVPTGTFSQVFAGDGNNCGVRTTATPVCWGHNTWGEGNPPAGDFISAESAWDFGCGIRTDATLACWGLNSPDGQATPPAGTFNSLGVNGNDYSCAIRTDKMLACWGLNVNHQLDPPAGTFDSVSVGTFFSCGVRTDQTLACWGPYPPFQATTPTPTPTPTPTVRPTPTPTPTPTPNGTHSTSTTQAATPISAAQAFSLPSARVCVSRRRFTIRVRKLPGVTFVNATVVVNGKRVKTVKRARITAPVKLTGLPKGRFTVKIAATTSDGRIVTGTRVYRTCTSKRHAPGPKL